MKPSPENLNTIKSGMEKTYNNRRLWVANKSPTVKEIFEQYPRFVDMPYLTSCDDNISDAEKVYRECQQSGPLSFGECIPPAATKHCIKIGEGKFAEVFSAISHSNNTVALKIIPVEGSHQVNGVHQKTFRELKSSMKSSFLSRISGISQQICYHCRERRGHRRKLKTQRSASALRKAPQPRKRAAPSTSSSETPTSTSPEDADKKESGVSTLESDKVI
ncbi:uncharacterized protein LOC120467042 [Pimephales promelas]|uniref:uncharacterized protein LOC120467042 n=1 Tax=Pimephales promelas TaxID=90988 RepID=UPI001955989F|nr:uncharacterized protein LOC120467042 [Pimephales promelas]